VKSYSYDALNRLKQAMENITPNGGSQSLSWQQTYTFDRYGNRSFDEANTTTLPKECTESGNPVVCEAIRPIVNPSVNAANNRLSSTGWQYDTSGNTTVDAEGRQFTYDAENKQTEVRDQYNTVIGEYAYDGDGKRVKKIVPATGEVTIFVYDAASKLIGEYSTVVQTGSSAKTVYTTNDHLGSPRINTDATGQVISRHDYHPFGEEISTAARTAALGYTADNIRQKFTLYERDNETDLDFAQARYYNSLHGRFNTVDPMFESMETALPQSMNRYTYVLNNPLFFIDPNGELWIIVEGQQNPQWVDKCPKNTICYTALALENENKGLNVYGSKNADDITEYDGNKDGQIDVRKLSQHPDAQFIVADGQNVPEEYLSVNAAGSLFNIAELYHQEYSNDEKLVFTAGNASDGKPGNCNGKPCHSGHKGNDIDLRYMDSSGKPLRGDTAYKNADLGRTNWLISAGKAYGFPHSYTGDETRFGRPDNTPKSRSATEKVHRNHLHIGKTAPKKK
jgi:RHS repeat-associated protein